MRKVGGGKITPQNKQKQANNERKTENASKGFITEQAERLKKLPQAGDKIQREFIEYIKYLEGIDLEKARDPMFDKRSHFNIDVRDLDKFGTGAVAGELALSRLKQLSRLNSNNFEFSIETNGAYRYAIFVKNKQYKKK